LIILAFHGIRFAISLMVFRGTPSNLVYLSSDIPAGRAAIHAFFASNSLNRDSISLKQTRHGEPTKFSG
jgi:hypothetical protein